MRKCAPALAAGCPLIIKPHRETPFSAIAAAKLFVEAGLPPGVINLLTTTQSGSVCESLLQHPVVRHITFTGSSRVGKWLGERAGGHMKGMTMELGGHAPFIVFEDADIELAVNDLLSRKFANAGQTCSCPARMFIHTSIADSFVKRFADGAAEIVVGDGMDPQVTMGPLQNARAIAKVEQHVHDAVTKGARVLFGGQRIQPQHGYFYAPTALTGATGEMLIMQQETFGPVAAFATFRDDNELFGVGNHESYGLTGYCYTRDLSRALRVADTLRCGFLGINDRRPQGAEVPMGGVGDSGIGREGGHWGIEEFTTTKLVSIRV
jgi:succinate-semialdehyde dehydrogenase/glutarate-semialdehyde dehydrogenase